MKLKKYPQYFSSEPKKGNYLKTQKKKSCKSCDLQDSVRRERDSNPRYLSVRRFSRPVHSTTLPSLQFSRMTIAWFLKASAKVMLYIELRKCFSKKVSVFNIC